MPDKPADNYQLVLEKVPEEKQLETALFLSGCFSLQPSRTKKIAAAGPIAILSGLQKRQAEAILAELKAGLPAGVAIDIALEVGNANISGLQWPRPPRVYGSRLEDYLHAGEAHDIRCPHCGGSIRVTQEANGFGAAPVGGGKKHPEDTAFLPAPGGSPVFSGFRPLVQGSGRLPSIQSLQAGDTGFWPVYSGEPPSPPAAAGPPDTEAGRTGGGTHDRKGAAKPATGLAAFMKPGAFAVVVKRTRDSQTIKMIADIMGIGETEARDLCLNLSLCVARGISLDEAQSLLARLQTLGAKARIVRPS